MKITINERTYPTVKIVGVNGAKNIFALDYISKHPRCRCGEVATAYGVSVQGMSRTLGNLVKDGYIKREVIGTEIVDFGGTLGEADIIGFSLA